MQTRSAICLLLQFTAAVVMLTIQDVHAQPSAGSRDGQSKIGSTDVATVLQRLGAEMEHGATRESELLKSGQAAACDRR